MAMKLFPDGAEGATPPPYSSIPRPALPPEIAESWDEEAESGLRQACLEAKLSNEQFGFFLSLLEKDAVADHESRQASLKAGFHALRQEWGEGFDRKWAQARAAVQHFDPALADLLEETGLGNHPSMARVFATLGESLFERGMVMPEINDNVGIEVTRKELRRLMANPGYLDSSKPNHKELVAKVNELAARVYGQQPPAGRD
jgi:hypothetical protein